MTTPIQAPDDARRDASASPPAGSRRGLLIASALGALAVFGVLAIASAIVGIGIRSDTDAGRAAITQGSRQLSAGELGRALEEFETAESRFASGADRASEGLGGLLGPRAGARPVVRCRGRRVRRGRDPRGRRRRPHTIDRRAPRRPRFARPVGRGSRSTRSRASPTTSNERRPTARGARDRSRHPHEPDPGAGRRRPVPRRGAGRRRQPHARGRLAHRRGMPSFAGADGPRRYIVIAEAPRSSAGPAASAAPTRFSTARNGSSRSGVPARSGRCPRPRPMQVPAPNPDYRRNWDHYGGAGSWRDMNMTPDFPTGGRAVLALYEFGTGERLDGVIVADPFAVKQLFRVTGPATEPSVGVQVAARTVVDFLSNEAYVLFETPTDRKAVLGDVVGVAFDGFLADTSEGVGKVEGDLEGRRRRPPQAVFDRRDDPARTRSAGLDRGLTAPEHSDLLAVHVNSRRPARSTSTRRDPFATTSNSAATGRPSPRPRSGSRTTSPTTGVSRYVIGPGIGIKGQVPGDNCLDRHRVVPGTVRADRGQRNGREQAMRVGEELGRPRYQDFFTTPGGERSTLTHRHPPRRRVDREFLRWGLPADRAAADDDPAHRGRGVDPRRRRARRSSGPASGWRIRDGAVVWRANPRGPRRSRRAVPGAGTVAMVAQPHPRIRLDLQTNTPGRCPGCAFP